MNPYPVTLTQAVAAERTAEFRRDAAARSRVRQARRAKRARRNAAPAAPLCREHLAVRSA